MIGKKHEMVLVLDFGGQYTQLIARRIRECGVFCEIAPFNTPIADIKAKKPKGIVLSGGPSSIYQENAPVCDPGVFKLGVPLLGICYGMQLTAHLLGGTVSRATSREYGNTRLFIDSSSGIFAQIPDETQVWMSHGDFIVAPPDGYSITAHSNSSKVAAMANPMTGAAVS